VTDIPPLTVPPSTPEACRSDRQKAVLAALCFGYLFMFTILLFWRGLPPGESGSTAVMLAGAAVAFCKDPLGFVFGSSQGSQDKTAALGAAAVATTEKTP